MEDFMRNLIKVLLPLTLVLGMAGCKTKTTSAHTPTNSMPLPTTSVRPTTATTTPTTSITDSLDTNVNLLLDLQEVSAESKPNLKDDWTSTFTYTYDKAIVLKSSSDFVLSPAFKTGRTLNVKITGFLEKGVTANDKLVLTVIGLDEGGKTVEEVEIKEDKIKGTKETPESFAVELKNSDKKIRRIKVGIKESGRATNFGINNLEITTK